MKTKLFIIFIVCMMLSCSVSKRKYMSGYHVDWSTATAKKVKAQNPELKQNKTYLSPSFQNLSPSKQEDLVASSNNELHSFLTPKHLSIQYLQDTCDVLTLKDGTEIRVKVVEINTTEILYKSCEDLRGTTYNVSKNIVNRVKYFNGRTENFETKPIPSISSTKVQPNPKITLNGPCDTLIFLNGDKLQVKVLNIKSNIIKYSFYDSSTGRYSLMSLKKNTSALSMIKYGDGRIEEFNKKPEDFQSLQSDSLKKARANGQVEDNKMANISWKSKIVVIASFIAFTVAILIGISLMVEALAYLALLFALIIPIALIVGTFTGYMAFKQIKLEPDKYSNKSKLRAQKGFGFCVTLLFLYFLILMLYAIGGSA